MSDSLSIWVTKFGKTKYVKATPYNMSAEDILTKQYDDMLWVVRPGECEYALMSPQMKNKRVAVVYERDFRNEIEI